MEARLRERVREISAELPVDQAMIAQEIVRAAARSDITEEVTRFRAHWRTGRRCRDSDEPCGRKLDFLLQEMNREINTIGSKADGLRVSELIINAKAELEKMREQVQNVEVTRRPAACCSSSRRRRARARRRWSSGWCRWCPICACRGRTPRGRPGPARQDGVDYNFISRERFEAMVREDAFLEWADVFGNYYGTGAADTDACLAAGEDVVLVIDVQGARQVRSRGYRDGRHLRAAAVGRGAGAAAARPQQGQRGADSHGGSRWRRREVGEFASTSTWSSTTRSTRRRAAAGDRLAERGRVKRCGAAAETIMDTFGTGERVQGQMVRPTGRRR